MTLNYLTFLKGDTMATKVHEIMEEIKDMEIYFSDKEGNCHYYSVEYSDGKIIISLVEEYYYYDECDEYVCDDVKEAFAHIDTSLEVAMNSFFDILAGAVAYQETKDSCFRLYSLVHVKRFR